MKPIQLTKEYTLERDSYSWRLSLSRQAERKNTKTGKNETYTIKDNWYYPDVKQLLDKLIDLELKSVDTIKDMVSKLEELQEAVKSLSNTIFKPQ